VSLSYRYNLLESFGKISVQGYYRSICVMLSFKKLGGLISLFFMVMLITPPASLDAKPNQDVYYTIPPVTYIRESPGYDSPNAATVYRGEQVKVLSRGAAGWCQVQTVQGRQVGWIHCQLLSTVPIATRIYYIQENKVALQDTPQKEGTSRKLLHRGDKVRKLSENQQGWWWVLSEKGNSLGWVPATAVSESEPKSPPPNRAAGPSGKGGVGVKASALQVSNQFFYVAIPFINLHRLPLVSSPVVKVLRFNDRVEKIDTSGSKWLKVRYPDTGAEGWAYSPYMAESSQEAPKVFPQKKRTKVRGPGRPKPTGPEKPEPEVKVEVM
jgi:SH3-like domain-containing protein